MKYLIIFFWLLGACWVSGQGSQHKIALASRIDSYLTQAEANGYSGTILVAHNKDIIFTKGYGMAYREAGIRNTPETVFNIGSVTKQFTAAAVLKLAEAGKLHPSDPIGRYVPGLPEGKANITLHQLIVQISGISPATGGFRYDAASLEDFIGVVAASELLYAPGTRHTYANANYILLAAAVEAAAEMAYETYLRQTFFEPLGMADTGYRQGVRDTARLAHGYYFDDVRGAWQDWGTTQDHLPAPEYHWFSIGKGDLYSTAGDLLTWHQALQERRVLGEASTALLQTPHVPESEGGTSFYGYGWAIMEDPALGKVVTHNGSNGIYFADLLRFVDSGWVVISLSNIRLNNASEGVAWEVSRMISDTAYQPASIPKNTHELVFEYIRSHSPAQASGLNEFLTERTGSGIPDKGLLNRIGLRQITHGRDAKWGLALLRLNTEVFPGDGNLWDSLGEAYYLLGRKSEAAAAFTHALELGDGVPCHWCGNAIQRLQTLEDAKAAAKGPYMGQDPPGQNPEVFAPGIVSTEHLEAEAAFSPDGREFYFMRQREGEAPKNYVMHYQDGTWSGPEEIETSQGGEVFIAPDNRTMYHGNTYRERLPSGWSGPQSLGTHFEPYPIMRLTASEAGTFFFDVREEVGAIRVSRLVAGTRQPPEVLPETINSGKWIAHPFIAPDESYLIWDAEREGGFGDSDLYVSFRQADGSWGPALNLGPEINTEHEDIFGSVTPDGNYLIYQTIDTTRPIRFANIHWVDAGVLEGLRNN
ncbi:serine hydrolase [Robiginitalea sediminis]|uniref:serine hydrolase n=1 Tax=Robiginitalea sediminis TaxID=1982593 RepID=UPI0013030B92|nr:serine hydrolase [Robiginitalea sediminis]